MTTTQRGILILLKSAITGEKLTLPEEFRLEDADTVIRSQSLLPLAYQGAFNCGFSRETELMRQYETQYYKILLQSERQMRAIKQIYRAFEENKIDYMPLKGCNLKQLYPQPELRMMGDADILIRMEQYEKIKSVLESLGFTEKDECGHEITWENKNLCLELHKWFFAPEERDFFSYFGDGWSKAVNLEKTRYGLQAEDEFVLLFTHMTKHYRGSGIGSRHFLDLYIFRKAHLDLDEQYIKNTMAKIGLLDFYHNINNLLMLWFENGEPDLKTEHITEYVFSSGSWGNLENLACSHQLKIQLGQKQIRNSKVKEMWEAIFPSADRMCYRYKILQKRPYLFPVFWPVRWIQLILTSPANIRKKIKMVSCVTDDKVKARKEMLEVVGLGFHDK